MLKKQVQIPIRLTAVRVRQLQLFAIAAEVGSISEAARRSHVTQPAATEMLQELERAFSIQLFTRGAKGVVLTPQGERVAVRAAAALRELQWAVSEAASSEPVREVLRVGFLAPGMFSYLPRAVERFNQKHPAVQLQLRQLNAPDSTLSLAEGDIDLAVTLNQPSFTQLEGPGKIHVTSLWEEHYRVFLSSRLCLPSRWEPTPEALRDLPWVLPPKESLTRGMFDDWFFLRGITPPVDYVEISPPMLAIELLRESPRASLLPDTLAVRENFPNLVPVAAAAFSLPARLICACKQSDVDRPSVAAFVQCLSHYPEQAGT